MFYILYLLVTWSAKPALEKGNEYTMRHFEMNELALNINIQLHVLMLIVIYSMNNFKIRIGVKCLDFTLLLILMVMRTALLCYWLYYLMPMAWKLVVIVYNMNHENWWKNPDEPFFTNGSVINAMICWVLWCAMRFYIFALMYISPILCLYILYKMISTGNFIKGVKTIFCDFCG